MYAMADRLPGQYSVSKLAMLEEFQQGCSRLHVAAILVLTPVPCLLIHLLVEAIPLADPVTGYSRSIAFQARYFIATVLQTTSSAMVKKNCVPDFHAGSWIMLAAFGVLQAVIGTGTNAIIAFASGVFPVPFTHFTPIVPMTVVGIFVCSRGQAWGPELAKFRAKSTQVDNRLGMEILPILVYPLFTVIFMAVSSLEQLFLSLLLPVIKLALRRWFWLVTKDDVDLIGITTCCAGHWYHLLFTGIIFQNAKSYESMAAIAMFNIVQMIINCRAIVRDAIAVNKAKDHLEKHIPSAIPADSVSSVLYFANQEDVAVKLHARNPTALLSTYPGYHGKSFSVRHKNIFRGISPVLIPSKASTPQRNASVKTAQAPVLSPPPILPRKEGGFASIFPSDNSFLLGIHDNGAVVQHSLGPFESQLPPGKSTKLASDSRSTLAREAYIQSLASALHQTEMIVLRSRQSGCNSSTVDVCFGNWLHEHLRYSHQTSSGVFGDVPACVCVANPLGHRPGQVRDFKSRDSRVPSRALWQWHNFPPK
ncbi:unnamed protein product [Phytophthora fragariaefolia]|uniref:Unnamed protein product n=1 Tax=Phytophthora fragariaefolia TaxID=1490495 RepID=A0A9W7D189_9STRA|nr:unnamed protein product [Phytophthora fragariaefolia]